MMDAIDRAIIEALRKNARIPNSALAEQVGLTPGPCLRRVQKLEADGVIINYHVQISPHVLEQSFEVFLDIELTQFDRDSVESFEATLSAFAQVLELHRLFGTPDYRARIAVTDLATYERFLSNDILSIPGISRVASRFPMKTIKSLRE